VKVLIVAGGTGGHLYPGIAVARALGAAQVRFVVRRGDLGRNILAKEGFAVEEIAGQGLPRALSLGVFIFPFRFAQGSVEARRLLKRFRPDWVLAMGGYLSVPVVLNARMLGMRILLHEQNVYPGLANRLLSRWADSVAVSFQQSAGYLKGKNVWVSGLPIRPDIGQIAKAAGLKHFGLGPDVPTYLVFGGSLGAKRLNYLAVEAWPLLLQKGCKFQVIHVTGMKDYKRIEERYEPLGLSAKVLPYCHEMAHAYAAASAVVCRAGASTVAELLAAKRPALLVPYPYASNNHQDYNARIIEKASLGRVILDADLSPSAIAQFLETAQPVDATPVPNSVPRDAAGRLAAYLTSGSR
jgi:UDP-N-acetylglucosamine--N-acetylmuramyl-(pentapeptide) pyrophosphoryl-undecaprenol N-acetylglucosamine transferase